MVSPIVSLYVAMAARTAMLTPAAPSPTSAPRIQRPVPGRPSPDPLRPGRGFHWRRPGSGGYGQDGQDTSTGLLIAIAAAAVVVALAAWLFLVWRDKHRRAAYAAPHSPYPEASRWDR